MSVPYRSGPWWWMVCSPVHSLLISFTGNTIHPSAQKLHREQTKAQGEKWSFYHLYIISRCWRGFFQCLFIAAFPLHPLSSVYWGGFQKAKQHHKTLLLDSLLLAALGSGVCPAESLLGEASHYTVSRICSIWTDNHSAAASSCCLMPSPNPMKAPRGLTKSLKKVESCSEDWRVYGGGPSPPLTNDNVPGGLRALQYGDEVGFVYLALSISPWMVKAATNLPPCLLWIKKDLANYILFFDIIILLR